MTPRRGNAFTLPFLPATPSWPLEGLFVLTRRPSKALNSPCALLAELQRNKDTVKCTAVQEVPRTPSQTAYANLDCLFVENALQSLIVEN